MNVKTLATALGVDVKTIQNYAKTAKELKLELRETKGSYNLLELAKFLHQMWKKAEKENKKNNFAKDEQERNYLLKNTLLELELKERAGELVSVDTAERGAAFFTVSANSAIDTTHNDLRTLLKNKIPAEVKNKIDEHFNDLKIYLSQLKIEGKFTNDDSLIDEDYTIIKKLEDSNE